MSASVNMSPVRQMCLSSVDPILFNFGTVICVDGTSCTGKTSLLAKTGRPVTKVQTQYRAENADTFGASMIGYVAAGMLNQSLDRRPRFNDRSPLNVIEWHVLWKLMNEYFKRFGNQRPDTNIEGMEAYMDEFRAVFELLKGWYVYKHFRQRINTVVLIDTDVDRCDRLMYARNEGSDRLRSHWRFYAPLQNLMYRQLYPGAVIDLHQLADLHEARTELAEFLNELLDRLTSSLGDTQTVPLNLAPPVTMVHGRDFNLHNISAHVYRSIGRAGVGEMTGENPPSFRERLEASLPGYVDVRGIRGPHTQLGRHERNLWGGHYVVHFCHECTPGLTRGDM